MDSIRSTIDNLFVPKDGLYYQAQSLINTFDSDGDGRINIEGLRASGGNAMLLGAPGRGFAAADELGNGNGVATIREVRNYLKRFDYDGSRELDGLEMLNVYGSAFIGGSIFGGGASGGARQAEQGASSIG